MTMSEQGDGLRVMGVRSMSDESEQYYGLTVPQWFITTMFKTGVPYSVDLFVRVDPEHGPLAVGVHVNANPGSGMTYKDAVALLKGAPLDRLLKDALVLATNSVTWDRGLVALGKPTGRGLTDEERKALGKHLEQTRVTEADVHTPIRRRSVTRELLREVAQIYRSAHEAGTPPTQAVAQHFTTTHSTAARWVREARKVGELGPSQGPTAGEASSSSE